MGAPTLFAVFMPTFAAVLASVELSVSGAHGSPPGRDGRDCAFHRKWTGWDLNPRPLPCQDSDLPADLPAQWAARKLAGLKRYPPRGEFKKVPGSCVVKDSPPSLDAMQSFS